MGQQLPPNLVPFFTRALKTFQLSKSSFEVLCSLPPAAEPSSPPSLSSSSEPAVRKPQQQQQQQQQQHGPPRTIFVLDSSFNPPTLAHQRMALSAVRDDQKKKKQKAEKAGTPSRVLLLLAINNADKAPKPAAFPQRLAMMYVFALDLLEATAASSAVEIDLAVTTEPYFHSKSGAVAGDPLFSGGGGAGQGEEAAAAEQVYLTGFDTLIRIFDGKYYPDGSMRQALDPFLARARLRVTMRPDADWGGAGEQRAYLGRLAAGGLEEAGGRREWAGRVEMVDEEEEHEAVISSTKVRDAVVGEDWDGLRGYVSAGVADWIRSEGLYREAEGAR
ncbi:hypothetical protein LQW54_005048 [Pestalotiopsis sp. IQ-011]